MSVSITGVIKGSSAYRAKIRQGETLFSINGNPIADVLDYQFYATDSALLLEIADESGALRNVRIRKEEYDDLGLMFDTYLMDKQRSCKNKCIFCFIDQMPKGMRKSLYFKDDDDRLSFLFGNYITLTNITEREIDRIIKMKISPINISIHTTNPALRVQMMANPHAGESLAFVQKLADAGIAINCQLVLCPQINDGEELVRSLSDLAKLFPALQSIACVPVGLTDHREGLAELMPYTKESANEVVSIVERFTESFYAEHGQRMAYAADEFYLKAQRSIPDSAYYGDFNQLENGVGMLACMREEFNGALENLTNSEKFVSVSLATGTAAYDFICCMVDELKQKWHNLECRVYCINNEFFGHKITVAGLITGGDLIKQLQGQPLGDRLLIPAVMLNKERTKFLDDRTPEQISEILSVPIETVDNDGYQFLSAITDQPL